MISRPMLAETAKDLNLIMFPVMASPKLDGIRCVIVGGKALSRKFKPIPNTYVREWLEANVPSGSDGELLVVGKSFNEVQSAIMREDGEPNFEYHIFDKVDSKHGLTQVFKERYNNAKEAVEEITSTITTTKVKLVPHVLIENLEQLNAYEVECVQEGYEGVMIRSLNGQYKCGRSTLKQGWLLKIKRFEDSEAEILGFEELRHNINELTTNELGLTKRSTAKEGMILAGTLGKFKVRDIKTKQEFDIGTGEGLTQTLRQEIWNNRTSYLGKLVKYKYQPAGQKDLPRFPVWLGFRNELDMDEE